MAKITAQPLSADERQQFMQAFLNEQGPYLSAAALDGIAVDGRGAVGIGIEGNSRALRTGGQAMANVVWLSDREARAPGGVGWPDDRTAGLIQRYDPDRQFVAVFDFDMRQSAVTGRIIDPG